MGDELADLLPTALTQLKLRGEALLELDAGSDQALDAVVRLLSENEALHGADTSVVRRRGAGTADVLLRMRDELREVRVAVIGNVDAGKARDQTC